MRVIHKSSTVIDEPWKDAKRRSAEAEGPLVFFRGIEMALLRAFPLHASIFLTCETIHAALAELREDGDAERRWKETGLT